MFLDFPIGTIIQWVDYADRNKNELPKRFLDQGWLECDGQVITKGKLKGKRTPDLTSNLTDNSIANFVYMMKCWHKNGDREEDED